jgi:chemotaxis protein CheX
MVATTVSATYGVYLPAFVDAAIGVFDTMLGLAISTGKPSIGGRDRVEAEISGIIGLSGDIKGMVVLSLGTEVALNATEALLTERHNEVDAQVADTVGELTNMVAGMAKGKLPGSLTMSLPSVVMGNSHCIVFPSEVTPVVIPFDCPWGNVIVEFGLADAANQ